MDRYRHLKRGTYYRLVGQGKLQTDKPLNDNSNLTIYMAEDDGRYWARSTKEFFDGRFVKVSEPEDNQKVQNDAVTLVDHIKSVMTDELKDVVLKQGLTSPTVTTLGSVDDHGAHRITLVKNTVKFMQDRGDEVDETSLPSYDICTDSSGHRVTLANTGISPVGLEIAKIMSFMWNLLYHVLSEDEDEVLLEGPTEEEGSRENGTTEEDGRTASTD